MAFELAGFAGGFHFGFPLNGVGAAALGLYLLALAVLAAVTWRRRGGAVLHQAKSRWLLLGLLTLLAPLAAEALLVRLAIPGLAPAPGIPAEPSTPIFSFLGALPWLVAGGLLGSWQAFGVGLAAGLARGAWETHNLLTPVHTALVAGLVGWSMRRNYDDWAGRLLRRPLVSGLLGGIVLGVLRVFELAAASRGSFFDSLDLALSSLGPMLIASLAEVGPAGLACELLRHRDPAAWYRPARLTTAPYNRSLTARLLVAIIALCLVAGAVLGYGDWYLARQSAQDMIQTQMMRAATQAGEAIPYFFQTGRSLMGALGQELASQVETGDVDSGELERQLRGVAFFRRLSVFNASGQALGEVPSQEPPAGLPSFEYEAALRATALGVPQEVSILPLMGEQPAQEVFAWPVFSPATGLPIGVVVGWTDLLSNPILQPVIHELSNLAPGEGFLTDEQGRILFHPVPGLVGTTFSGPLAEQEGIHSDRAPDGTARLVYVYPVAGSSWRVVVTMPGREVEALAMTIAGRLLAVVLVVGLVAVALVYFASRRLTQPLREMAVAAEAMARGSLSAPVGFGGEDEIGRLASSFERMRRNLKSRLDEMDLLLTASQRMASSFELSEVLPPILAGVQALTGADFVRLALETDGGEPAGAPEAYHTGTVSGEWRALDAQVLELCKRRGRFVLENPSRARAVLDLEALNAPLEALMALPLRNEDEFVGALWLGHSAPHPFATDEVNLLSILAGQLGVSVANARLYHEAEQERRKLTAILSATPDAVLVTDRQGKISLANPAAEVILRGKPEEALGQPALDWITVAEVAKLLTTSGDGPRTAEVTVGGGRVMFASVSDIEPRGAEVPGRVCVLGDITHYKRLDLLKSEFVSTVSHDLRAPLTLMRGYATMLTMVGNLTDKQKEFVHKILSSVESMAQLVDNVLDLGRIEAGVGLSLETVRVETVLRDVVSAYRPQAVNKQIGLEVELAEGMGPIEADPTLLRQAVANLIDNGIKFTLAGGRVKVRAVQQGGRQLISVQDTGLGIAAADQARLFEKFYRGQRRESLQEKGSGLGLAIVKSIAEQHGGRVSVESRLGVGSTFSLELPLRRAGAGGGPEVPSEAAES
jgi:PAS domain S-box-containing protein